jgi:ribose 5-phosphate isomerase A
MVSVRAMRPDETKKRAALAAVAELPDHGVIGLGSGSTARFFIEEVATGVRAGRKWVGVPTSEQSRRQAEELGIPLLGAEGPWPIDVTVDGADEVDVALNVIKGGGAAHTREKIVNQASRRNVIIVGAEKLSTRLGEKRAVPVEVLRFGHRETARSLGRFGRAVLRATDAGPTLTDSGNYIYDLACGPLDDPAGLERALSAVAGVVETGLFVARVDIVIVAREDGTVERLSR